MKKTSAAIVLSNEEEDFERIRQLEVALHERAAAIQDAAMRAPDIAPGDETYPPEWERDFGGKEAAERAFRVAKAAWGSQKDAPIFLKMAQAFLVGAMKARASEDRAPRILNATLVQTTAPLPVFPERIVQSDDDD